MILVDRIGAAQLFRGPRPTITELRQVKFDINLEEGWFEFFHGEAREEQERCTLLNVSYFHKPLSDFFTPARKDILTVIDQARFWLFKGHSVLIHCLHGQDRTGIVIAAYRIKYQGWSVEDAVKEMNAYGFHNFPYGFWVKVLNEI